MRALLLVCFTAACAAAATAAPALTTTTSCAAVRLGVVSCSADGKVSLGGQVVPGLSCKAASCAGVAAFAAAATTAAANNDDGGGLAGVVDAKINLINTLASFGKPQATTAAGRKLHFLTDLKITTSTTTPAAPTATPSSSSSSSCFQACTTTTEPSGARQQDAAAAAAAEKKALAAVVYASKNGIPDYGSPCTSGSQCASGICGTSCSKRDWQPARTTSCLCPTNDPEPAGCCGCLSYDPAAPPGSPAVVGVCPSGSASAEAPYETPLAPLPRGTLSTMYARLSEVGAMDDTLVEAGAPAEKYIKVTGFSPSAERAVGGKAFGEACERNDECRWGICGTGCDCDSSVEERCSCNAQSSFPFKTCGGCNRGMGAGGVVVGACPKGVNITSFDGPSTWVPQKGDQVSLSYCILLALEVRVNGLRLPGAGGAPPSACVDSPDKKKVWAAIQGVDDKNPRAVDDLFEMLALTVCKTPASDPAGCQCDYVALVDAFGLAKIDPAICRPPPPEEAEAEDADEGTVAAVGTPMAAAPAKIAIIDLLLLKKQPLLAAGRR